MAKPKITETAGAEAPEVKKEESKNITVTAVRPIFEGGVAYAAGDAFEVTADRAKALGALVKAAE